MPCPWPKFTTTLERLRHIEALTLDAWRNAESRDKHECVGVIYRVVRDRADSIEELEHEATASHSG